MSVQDLKKVEKTVKDALNKLGEEYPGLYYSMQTTPLPTEIEISLSSDHVFFSRKGRETCSETNLWPFGRGIYHNRARDLVLWVNESDHVIIKSIEKRGNVRMMTSRLCLFLNSISKHLKFVKDENYGYLSVNPANLGAGLEVSIIARLPNLAKNYAKLKLLCANYDIIIRRQNQFFFELASTKKLGLTEFQIIVTFFNGVREILEYERSLL